MSGISCTHLVLTLTVRSGTGKYESGDSGLF